MTDKPETTGQPNYPVWATDPTDPGGNPTAVEPSSGKQAAGWLKDERPAKETQNWWQNNAYLWVQHLDTERLLAADRIIYVDPDNGGTAAANSANGRGIPFSTVAEALDEIQSQRGGGDAGAIGTVNEFWEVRVADGVVLDEDVVIDIQWVSLRMGASTSLASARTVKIKNVVTGGASPVVMLDGFLSGEVIVEYTAADETAAGTPGTVDHTVLFKNSVVNIVRVNNTATISASNFTADLNFYGGGFGDTLSISPELHADKATVGFFSGFGASGPLELSELLGGTAGQGSPYDAASYANLANNAAVDLSTSALDTLISDTIASPNSAFDTLRELLASDPFQLDYSDNEGTTRRYLGGHIEKETYNVVGGGSQRWLRIGAIEAGFSGSAGRGGGMIQLSITGGGADPVDYTVVVSHGFDGDNGLTLLAGSNGSTTPTTGINAIRLSEDDTTNADRAFIEIEVIPDASVDFTVEASARRDFATQDIILFSQASGDFSNDADADFTPENTTEMLLTSLVTGVANNNFDASTNQLYRIDESVFRYKAVEIQDTAAGAIKLFRNLDTPLDQYIGIDDAGGDDALKFLNGAGAKNVVLHSDLVCSNIITSDITTSYTTIENCGSGFAAGFYLFLIHFAGTGSGVDRTVDFFAGEDFGASGFKVLGALSFDFDGTGTGAPDINVAIALHVNTLASNDLVLRAKATTSITRDTGQTSFADLYKIQI